MLISSRRLLRSSTAHEKPPPSPLSPLRQKVLALVGYLSQARELSFYRTERQEAWNVLSIGTLGEWLRA